MSKTYKDQCKELNSAVKYLNDLNYQLRKNIEELQKVLSGEIDIKPYVNMEEKARTYEYALRMIHAVSNEATQAWDIANSVLEKYETL
jgi:hypothetical protein